ncbi:MAG: glycosyltransferase [Phycisphaerae bacterium]|nr:glycosyltransferase [Phycisphaerae bacterium]
MRIAMMQRMICGYQMPFYLLLNERLKRKNIYLNVFCGSTQDNGYVYEDTFFSRLFQIKFNVKIGGLQDKLIILPTLFAALVKYKPDVVVAEDISAMPNCITVLLYCKLFKIPYIVWGLGAIPNKKPSRIRVFLEPVISVFRKGAQSMLCYSSYAEDYYRSKYKKRCHIAYNSTTMRHSPQEYEKIQANISLKYKNPDPLNITFIGRLIPQKKIDLLLAAISKIQTGIPIRLSVIGDGNIKSGLSQLCQRLNISDKVHFLGEISDHREKARIFMNTHLGVLPGLGGLAVQEMMWYGIPVIASSADGTEQDLIVKGKAGVYIEKIDENKLCKAILSFINMGCDAKALLALNALKVVYEKYNIDSMLDAFEQCVNIKNNTNCDMEKYEQRTILQK